MEFLKGLFTGGEALTFEQLVEKAKAAKINAVNLADGGYVSKDKFDDKVNTLSQQVTDLQGQIEQRDADMIDLQGKLTAAQTDAAKLGEVSQSFSDLKAKYDADKQSYEQKLAQQSYEFMVREKANELQFSSGAAKKAFIQEANSKGFKVDGESLLGFDDFLAKYKADDPGAFRADAPTEGGDAGQKPPKPDIVLPPTGKSNGGSSDLFHFTFNGVRPAPKSDAE